MRYNNLFARFVFALVFVSTSVFAQKIVYMREWNDSKQIYWANADGSNPKALTSGANWHLYPDITSDGWTVAYASGRDERSLEIYTEDLDNGKKTLWSKTAGMNLHPRFSGDGNCLAYSGPTSTQDTTQRIHLVNLKTGTQVAIESAKSAYFPSLNSDCSVLIYQRNLADGFKEIVRYDLKEKKEQALTATGTINMSPTLSFDDVWVAFTSKVNGNWDVYALNLITQKTVRVTNHDANDFAPAFSPAGKIIFASNRSGHFELYETTLPQDEKSVSTVVPFIAGEGDHYSPNFSGDRLYLIGTKESFPAPERSSFGSIKVGNRIYIVGGHQGPEHTYPKESFLNRVDYYDTITQRWYNASPRSVAAHGFSLANYGKYIYAFGGFTFSEDHLPKWKSLDIIERYDTENDKWEVVGKLPRPRSSNVVAVVGHKAYLLGGWNSTPKHPKDFEGKFHSEIDVYDFKTGEVSTAAYSLPNPLRRALTGVVKDGKIILIGGLGVGASHFELLDNVTQIDPETGATKELPKLPFATFAPAAEFIKDTLYVFGGMFKLGKMDYAYVNHIYALGKDSQTWLHTGRHLSESKGFSQVVSLSTYVLAILGGHTYKDEHDHPVSTFEIFIENK